MVVSGVRSTGGGTGAARQNVFDREWLYINLQSESEGGCQVTVRASFKRDTTSSLSKVAVRDALDGGELSKTDRSAAHSPLTSLRFSGGGGGGGPQDSNSADELNFNTWSLGPGKMRDKRLRLENFVKTLMDRNNKKLKQQHDAHCSKSRDITHLSDKVCFVCRNDQEEAQSGPDPVRKVG